MCFRGVVIGRLWGGLGVVVCGMGCWGWPDRPDKVGLDDSSRMSNRKTILGILSGTVLLVANQAIKRLVKLNSGFLRKKENFIWSTD